MRYIHFLYVFKHAREFFVHQPVMRVSQTYMSFHQLYLEWERVVTDCPQQVTVLGLGGHQKQGAWNKERPKYTAFRNHQMNLKYEITYNSMYMLHGGFSIKLKHYCLQLIRKNKCSCQIILLNQGNTLQLPVLNVLKRISP